MPGEPQRLGPFAGGINTVSDPAALQDVELVDAVNFEVDLDGSLKSRPPVTAQSSTGLSAGSRILLLGFGRFGSTNVLVGGRNDATWWLNSGTWTKIKDTQISYRAVQYKDTANNDKLWFLAAPSSPVAGGHWSPALGYTEVAAVPRGTCAATHKERLFVAGSSTNPQRVYFSAPADWTSWPANNFFDVRAGDGQPIVDIVVYNDNIFIFKTNSTFFWTYETDPTKGVLREINSVIGVSKRKCVATYENNLYVFHNGNVYEVVNTDFDRINAKVPFTYDAAGGPYDEGESLSIVGDRLVARFYNLIYVFDFRTRTWTRWESPLRFGPFVPMPVDPTTTTIPEYWAGAANASNAVHRIKDGYDTTSVENMTCSLRTKNYDIGGISHKYKRLFWFGCDVNSPNPVTGIASPVVFGFSPTHLQLSEFTWSQFNTWDSPLSVPSVVSTIVPTASGGVRRFIKFVGRLRFRQIAFEFILTTDGTLQTGPARFFSGTIFVLPKETVVHAVS